ncbi:MAG TPA: alanine--glyoxylate aminotransferase family protein [Planctomycetota bacterium]|nr:alanine--glyoxylate aminotransferase family protein [Planctomycetota bacterium]
MSAEPPRLWIPGPTWVRPEILAVCARPMIGHRGSAMKERIGSIDTRLRDLFGTKQHVLVLTASGSAAWEAAIRCSVASRWCVATNGAFSERWAGIGAECGRETVRVEHAWGDGLSVDRIAEAIRRGGRFDAVAFVQNETSTGAWSDVPAIARAAREAAPDALLFVDCVSSLAGAPFEFDAWGLDVALASSQKCLALPPGIAVVALSDRFLERAKSMAGRGYYLDLVRAAEDWANQQTPATPAVSLFAALDEQLRAFERETLAARFERHRAMERETHAWAEARGFESFVAPAHRSPTTSCRRAPRLDIAAFVKGLRARGHEISDGYGKLKGQTFRIGHMGDHSLAELRSLLGSADDLLDSMRRR